MNEVTSNLMEYLLGGRAEFTLEQEGSMQMKYKLIANDNHSCFFVYTEPPRGGKAIYQGHIVRRTMSFTRGEKVLDEDYNLKAINALGWLFRHCNNLPNIVHVYHNGRCSRCGRKLTDAESLRTGLGPTCRERGRYV